MVTVSPVEPPIVFELGSNANKNDLQEQISVLLGNNKTSASITVHPTYQVTYYKGVLNISNTDSKAYYVHIKVVNPITGWPSGSNVTLCIYGANTARQLIDWPTPKAVGAIKGVDLTTTGTIYIDTLDVDEKWEVDVYVHIPEGSGLPSSATAYLLLVYSPSGEAPP